MFLIVGNRLRVDDPTPEQIARHLRNLPADAPFLVLDADEEHFIQATPVGDRFRVEWRQESQQRYVLVPAERAEEAFLAYRRWDEAALKTFPWRRITVFNDPYRRLIFVAIAFVGLAVLIAWLNFR